MKQTRCIPNLFLYSTRYTIDRNRYSLPSINNCLKSSNNRSYRNVKNAPKKAIKLLPKSWNFW